MARRKQGWVTAPEAGQPFHSPFAHLAARPPAAQPAEPAAVSPATPPTPPTPAAPSPPEWPKMVLRMQHERKGRAGKSVTLVAGFDSQADARAAADLLRRGLGCGAQVEGEEVVLQGDQRERAATLLSRQGVRRLAGRG